MKRFYSKIGAEVVIPIGLIIGFTSAIMMIQKALVGLAINLLVILFIVHLITTTFYQVEGKSLRIKSGFIINRLIVIDSIHKIQKSNSLFSSPAVSLDRLEIFYNKNDSILISPKDKHKFLAELQKINPAIEINV
jgi:hypothetical protein